ncbi:MAG: carbonic anhydrase family protein [Neisseria sp.]|nr:carbonic anhydrase family protein [Neisseria sp.]
MFRLPLPAPRFAAAVLSVLLAASAAAHEGHTHWGYTGHDAPESWGSLSEEFRLCSTGKSQSPVNIVETVPGRLPAIKADYRPARAVVENNGHTIQVSYPDGGGTLTAGGRVFTLKQFHFHVPSENQIKGKTFPMEAHFVHLDENRQPLVLALLYEDGKTNARLSPVWDVMPMKEGKAQPDKAFDASSLLPRDLAYYRFSGSLTTPPCTEGVSWLVLKAYDHISREQAEKFTRAIGSHNNRPVQPLNARVVVE